MPETRILNDRYELGGLIGRGGMADVFEGQDTRLGRRIAIKMMRPDLARDPQFQSRFRREAQSSASLNHPNIVAVFDTGEEELPDQHQHEIACPFLVMEYVSGSTLRALVRAGEVTVDQAVTWVSGVLSALSYSHEHGIVHRDIKPANVMVTDAGEIKVMDFGIARALADSSATMTQTQAVVGTAQYLSPEQARGEQVDSRSDLYSVGCLLFELLTGRPPFIGDSPVSVAYQHVREEPPVASTLNPEVTAAVESVLAKGLAKDLNDRFQSGDEFRAALVDAHHNGTSVASGGGAASTGSAGAEDNSDAGAATTVLAAGGAGAAAAHTASGADRTQTMSAVGGQDDVTPTETTPQDSVADVMGTQDPRDVEQRERKSNKRIIIAIVMILLALGAVAGGWWVMNEINQRNIEANQVTVPEVTDMSQNEAQNELTAAGLRPLIEEAHHDEVESGNAIGTEPENGETVQRDDEVTLEISLGPDQVVLPEDLTGASEATVRDTLEELGLTISSVDYVNSPTIEWDRLVTTNPELGSTVAYGATVQLQMSSGQVEVPSLMGMTEDEATAALEDVGLGVSVNEGEAEEAPEIGFDAVTNQSHAAGESVDQGTPVEFTITTEAEEEPSPTPTENEEDSDSPSPSDEDESASPTESDSPSPTDSDSDSESPSGSDSESPSETESPSDDES